MIFFLWVSVRSHCFPVPFLPNAVECLLDITVTDISLFLFFFFFLVVFCQLSQSVNLTCWALVAHNQHWASGRISYVLSFILCRIMEEKLLVLWHKKKPNVPVIWTVQFVLLLYLGIKTECFQFPYLSGECEKHLRPSAYGAASSSSTMMLSTPGAFMHLAILIASFISLLSIFNISSSFVVTRGWQSVSLHKKTTS